ncbi:MAG: argininosuccinate lyase [Clostridia bacterium]|nr:argininosuccinate lyase [Clostridia bacterium]
MEKLWTGRFKKALDAEVNDFNSSIRFDSRMYRQDITGSIAHASMLGKQGIITPAEAEEIKENLAQILADLDAGALEIDPMAEDIHSFVEAALTARIGDTGKKLHTARSRNDQVAVDIRLYLRDRLDAVKTQLTALCRELLRLATEHRDTIMPGYTHLQRAQPITFGHQLMAYEMMFLRDIDRLNDCRKRMNVSPLGSCALAGTTFDTDRYYEAELLGFDGISENSIDGVSDRDFIIELSSAFSILMMHLSRFSEEIILWCSWEFKFIELDDAYSTGSSIMPQKKNPDIAELVRGKTGRVYGDLMGILTVMKGIPLAYNKDMQEDKEGVFDAADTVEQCLKVFTPMLATMRVLKENMKNAAAKGFINATDCADYLVTKGLPFRTAYKITGEIVGYCVETGKTLESLTQDEYLQFSDKFEPDLFGSIDMAVCVAKRTSAGGAAPQSVDKEILWAENRLKTLLD